MRVKEAQNVPGLSGVRLSNVEISASDATTIAIHVKTEDVKTEVKTEEVKTEVKAEEVKTEEVQTKEVKTEVKTVVKTEVIPEEVKTEEVKTKVNTEHGMRHMDSIKSHTCENVDSRVEETP